MLNTLSRWKYIMIYIPPRPFGMTFLALQIGIHIMFNGIEWKSKSKLHVYRKYNQNQHREKNAVDCHTLAFTLLDIFILRCISAEFVFFFVYCTSSLVCVLRLTIYSSSAVAIWREKRKTFNNREKRKNKNANVHKRMEWADWVGRRDSVCDIKSERNNNTDF